MHLLARTAEDSVAVSYLLSLSTGIPDTRQDVSGLHHAEDSSMFGIKFLEITAAMLNFRGSEDPREARRDYQSKDCCKSDAIMELHPLTLKSGRNSVLLELGDCLEKNALTCHIVERSNTPVKFDQLRRSKPSNEEPR